MIGLRGRAPECAALDAMLAAVRSGQSRTLVVRGEAGVGKTALLEYLVDSGSDLRVLRAGGVESEMELAFAGVHMLCAPLLDRLERLPAPQREALEVVFGLSGGQAPDRLLVGLAVLGLLADAAEERPVICVVDDAHWLDQASAQVVALVARRLLAESVAVVFAAREPGAELRALPELVVAGLRDADARALLTSAVPFPLDKRVRDRIVAETRGNPLALLELPRGMTAAQLAGGFGLIGGESLSGRIEEGFRVRLGGLSSEVQLFLLVAAAEPIGDPLVVWGAAERLGIDGTAAAAETDGLLEIGARVTFRHPLVRSAIYQAAPAKDRRGVHLALAEVTDQEVDPDRRVWHLAAAAPGPDEDVASELERSAGRAQARGGLAAAAAFLRLSLELTRDPARQADRALAAAQVSLQAGSFDAALQLLETAETGKLDEIRRARVDLLRGQIAFASGIGADAPALLLKAAKRLAPLDLDLARETLLDAWGAAIVAERVGGDDLLEICRAARALPPPTEPPRAVDALLDAMAVLITDGRAAAAPAALRAASAFTSEDIPLEAGIRWGWVASAAHSTLWDFDGLRAINEFQVQRARDVGALEKLPLYLIALGVVDVCDGDFAAAAAVIAEAEAVTAATGSSIPPFADLLLVCLRGKESEAFTMIEATRPDSESVNGFAATQAYWAAAIFYNGLGRYEEALAEARKACADPSDRLFSMWALPELIEAAARAGQVEVARDGLERLTKTTRPAGTDLGLGIEARSSALLSDEQAAEGLYREAVQRLGRTRQRPDLARAHLLYGEWLRRQGRRIDARFQLRTASEMFAVIGMQAFGERARRELIATGETVRKRTAATRDDLTAQERQVAQLASKGLSNADIGARLFISARTVKYHLRKVFGKLDIASRHELGRVLPADTL
jgi:DNA-binding CsgD family transcriptional regulator